MERIFDEWYSLAGGFENKWWGTERASLTQPMNLIFTRGLATAAVKWSMEKDGSLTPKIARIIRQMGVLLPAEVRACKKYGLVLPEPPYRGIEPVRDLKEGDLLRKRVGFFRANSTY